MDGTKLRPQLGMFDAISTGLAAILGAGIFAVIAPAAGIAGPSLLISLVIAAFVAFCNALSSTQLAAVFPHSGGTYEFGRHMLGPWAGYLAGWMFLAANTVGPGVSALVFGGYLHAIWSVIPARTAAVLAALVMTGLNAGGIKRSARVTDIVVILSIMSLLAFVVIGLPHARISNLSPFNTGGIGGILRATGLLFFAYTGYSRIATLVEEVRNPKRTIPIATITALGTAVVLYLLVATTTLAILGASGVSKSASPLETTMTMLESTLGIIIISTSALLTTFNEGLSDLLGVSRVAFAMGRETDLPKVLAKLGKEQNPWRSVLFVGTISILIAAFAPLTIAIAVSSFGILLYYSITNISAFRLPTPLRMFPHWLPIAGLIGCLALAFSLAPKEIGLGLAILLVGIIFRVFRLLVLKRRKSNVHRF